MSSPVRPQRSCAWSVAWGRWRGGVPVVLRALAGALFEELHVKGGTTIGWKPRLERAAEVERLMDEVAPGSGAVGVHSRRICSRGLANGLRPG